MTLEARSISHAFHSTGRRVPALLDVSAEAAAGRVTALIGPNAAGKSTLLRCLAGLLDPERGDVLLDGRSVRASSPAARAARLAYVAQRPSVAAAFTVRDVVALGRFALTPGRRRIEAALERWDLASLADRPFPALSVGQQHRVSLARATAQISTTGVLLLDEPTAAMDLAHAATTISVLRELAAHGATVVVSLHDLHVASALADDLWILHHGRLVEAGPATDLLVPERLSPVFGVSFDAVRVNGATIPVPHLDASS